MRMMCCCCHAKWHTRCARAAIYTWKNNSQSVTKSTARAERNIIYWIIVLCTHACARAPLCVYTRAVLFSAYTRPFDGERYQNTIWSHTSPRAHSYYSLSTRPTEINNEYIKSKRHSAQMMGQMLHYFMLKSACWLLTRQDYCFKLQITPLWPGHQELCELILIACTGKFKNYQSLLENTLKDLNWEIFSLRARREIYFFSN